MTWIHWSRITLFVLVCPPLLLSRVRPCFGLWLLVSVSPHRCSTLCDGQPHRAANNSEEEPHQLC